MPDDLYWDDTLLWSEHQSALLRRLAAGERVNDVDWEHVIEEIEDVGKTELRACESCIRQALVHLLKLHLWQESDAVPHWRGEARAFLTGARRAFSQSMRQKLDIAGIYADAREIVEERGQEPAPTLCPFTLDDLLTTPSDIDALLARLDMPMP